MKNTKKLFAVGATAALMLAASSPAFAQAVADDGGIAFDDDTTTTDVQFLDASQFQVALQVNTGDANAVADDGSFATASIEQDLTQIQVNGGFGDGFFFVD